jgi:hypothetical protein
MKKLIGVAVVLFTLVISIVYRQLTARTAGDRPAKANIRAKGGARAEGCACAKDCVRTGLREGMMLSRLLLQ